MIGAGYSSGYSPIIKEDGTIEQTPSLTMINSLLRVAL